MKPSTLRKLLATLVFGLAVSDAALASVYTYRLAAPGVRPNGTTAQPSQPAASAPVLSVQQPGTGTVLSSIPFPSTVVGSESSPITVNLANTGTGNFVFGSPALSVAAPFNLVSTTCVGTLAPNAPPCQVPLSFTPVGTTAASGALAAKSSTGTTPLVNATGTGLAADIDPYFANVTLLMHFDGAQGASVFTDETGKNTITSVAATTTSARAKFGTGSVASNGSTSRLTATNASSFAFGTGDFTVEGWYYFTTNVGMFFDSRPDGTNGAYANAGFDNGLFAYTVNGVNHALAPAGYAFPLNAWTHVATVRASGTVSMYVNGNRTSSTYVDTTNLGASRMVFLQNGGFSGNTQINGNVDEIRVTKGVARYNGNFTPPTAAFPNR